MFRQRSVVSTDMFDVFQVKQLTKNSKLSSVVGVDLVTVGPMRTSKAHRHNNAETILYITGGSGSVMVRGRMIRVTEGMRIRIPKGAYHSVHTGSEPLRFISIQSPPIYDGKSKALDLEPLKAAEAKRP